MRPKWKFKRLFNCVRRRLHSKLLSGHVFLFCNARKSRLKLLVWDGSRVWICAKKLAKGCCSPPERRAGETTVVLRPEELPMLLGGTDLGQARHRPWHRNLL